MGYFTPVTKEVQIDEENYVTIRKMTYGEQQGLISQSVKIKILPNGQGESFVDTGILQLETVKLLMVAWRGPGFEGRACTPENVAGLPAWVVARAISEIDALNAPMGDSEKKALTGP